MLTPVDIQQKRFHVGLGYDKKDVNTFFEEVARSYEELYRSNADLKDRVITLTEGLQNYKSKEAALEKSLMLAEKDSEDTKSRANKEARTIKSEARAKAQSILQDAEKRLEEIKAEVALLETQYAAYKTNFCNLMKRQFEFLKEEDFDADSYIDEKALGVLVTAGGGVVSSANSSFGSFTGDPQMRDESTLGGRSGSIGSGMSRDDLNSTSAVYTSGLGANDNFVDPFNPTNKGNGRYNPYDNLNPKKDRTNETSENTGEKKTTFTVNSGNSRARRSTATPKTNTGSSHSGVTSSEAKVTEDVSPQEDRDVREDTFNSDYSESKVSYSESVDDTYDSAEENISAIDNDYDDIDNLDFEHLDNTKYDASVDADDSDDMNYDTATGADAFEDDEMAEILDAEEKVAGRALLSEDDSSEETDEYGFEFV